MTDLLIGSRERRDELPGPRVDSRAKDQLDWRKTDSERSPPR